MWNFLGPAQRIAQANPWLKWAVVVLVGLFAVEFIAQRGIGLYRDLATVKLQTDAVNVENAKKVKITTQQTAVDTMSWTSDQKKAVICGDPKLRRSFGKEQGCPLD